MKQCECEAGTLAQYLDGELSPEHASFIQQHVGNCPQCAAEVSALVSLRRGLKAADRRFIPTDEFRRKIQQQVSQKPRRAWNMRYAWAFAALAVILVASLVWLRQPQHADSFSEIADLHASALASNNPVDVVSTDRHTVKPWFQGRIPFSFNIPELAGTEFTLLGGRVVYLNQQPGAQLIFTLRQHRISALVFRESSVLPGELTAGGDVEKRSSFNVAVWSNQNLRFVVIGDADPNEIRKLDQMIRAANE